VLNGGRIRVSSVGGARAASRLDFEPATVRITGPRRIVRQLRGIYPTALSITAGDTLPHVADLDTAGLGVTVAPAQVKVRARSAAAGTP
jgi:hypothetical protein